MNATRRLTGLAALLALCLVLGSASSAYAQAAAAGSQDPGAKQPYTMAEYNSYKACADDKVPASQISFPSTPTPRFFSTSITTITRHTVRKRTTQRSSKTRTS